MSRPAPCVLRRRLARQAREAALRATPAQLDELHEIARLVQLGHLAVPTASDRVATMLREQQNPAGRRSSVVTVEAMRCRKLANLAREVTHHARDGREAEQIAQVVDAAHTGVLSFEQARLSLAALRADQRETLRAA